MSIRLAQQVAVWGTPTVLLIGDAIKDVDVHGVTSRFSSDSPGTIVHTQTDIVVGGGGALAVQAMLSALGGEVTLCMGRISTKTRYYVGGHQVFRADEDAEQVPPITSATEQGSVYAWLGRVIGTVDAVVLSDYQKGRCADGLIRFAIERAESRGIPCLVDPHNRKDWSIYHGAAVIKARREDWAFATKRPTVPNLILTDGPLGAQHEPSGEWYRGRERRSVDPRGCGDAFLAATTMALLARADVPDMCTIANAVAGLKVQRVGAVSITREELILDLLHGEKVLPQDLLPYLGRAIHLGGEEVAVANGCFDGLHYGHHALLAAAKSLGNRLVVLVNDDASVRRLKGEGRPRLGVGRRMEMLAGLSCVDYVIPFPGDTPEAEIEALVPDVLVKGGDWAGKLVAGADFVRSRGGDVVFVGRVPGFSSSDPAK